MACEVNPHTEERRSQKKIGLDRGKINTSNVGYLRKM